MVNRILLMGFMGSGKTAMAKALAVQMGMKFLDLDQWIEQQEGRSIAEIFATDGETAFRKIEQQALQTVLQQEHTVIALGGGTPCFFDNMERMLNSGICVYLHSAALTLFEYLARQPGARPLITHKTKTELKAWVISELSIREPVYMKAHLHCDAFKCTAPLLAQMITDYSKK